MDFQQYAEFYISNYSLSDISAHTTLNNSFHVHGVMVCFGASVSNQINAKSFELFSEKGIEENRRQEIVATFYSRHLR